jgi:hypothetical protein
MSTRAIETWKPIPGYIGLYEVSDLGRVRAVERIIIQNNQHGTYARTLREHIVAQLPSSKGYLRVHLSRNGVTKKHLVHHLVLEAHIGPRPSGMQACHRDDDKDNNELWNLKWASPEENIADRFRNGGYKFARRTHCKRNHELRGSNVYVARDGHRTCMACVRIRKAEKNEVAA